MNEQGLDLMTVDTHKTDGLVMPVDRDEERAVGQVVILYLDADVGEIG